MNGPRRKRSHTTPAVVVALTTLAAYLARVWAERNLDYGEPVPLLGNPFRLALGENSGVAFGLLGGSPLVPWLSTLALVAFALLLARSLLGSRAGGAALGLILGGGLANLLDRLGDRSVTDYLDVGAGSWRWPTFNLPDVAITAGVLLVVWLLLRGEGAFEEPKAEPAAGPLPHARGRAPRVSDGDDGP